MAVMAVQIGRNVVVVLTCRCHPMAGITIVSDACVIKRRRFKARGVMTDATILVGYYVTVWFASGKTSAMT